MDITCVQMDVLISFYIENELSEALRKKVEQHLQDCPTCRAKYNIITSLFSEIKDSLEEDNEDEKIYNTKSYKSFHTNLSAYLDNELPPEENIKVKKFTITNKKARKELEDSYNIRRLMKDSYKKTKSVSNKDFTKNIMKKLDIENAKELAFNPLIKVAFAFVITVLVLSAIIIISLSF